jgi:hypothetical protein
VGILNLKENDMKKYDKIMGAFGKTADKLMALNEANAKKATRLIAKVDEIEAEIASVAAEASQAYLMAEKINEFMEI